MITQKNVAGKVFVRTIKDATFGAKNGSWRQAKNNTKEQTPLKRF